MARLRVGLLLEGDRVPAWVARFIEQAQASAVVRFELVVLLEPPTAQSDLAHKLYPIFLRMDRRLFKPVSDALVERPLETCLPGVPQVRWWGAETADQIRGMGLDVLIHTGFGPLPDGLFALQGVWGFAPQKPLGFWEVHRQQPMQALLARLDVDPAQVLYRSYIPSDPHTVGRAVDKLLWKYASVLVRWLVKLSAQGSQSKGEQTQVPFEAPSLGFPGVCQIVKQTARLFPYRVSDKIHKWFFLDQWIVLVKHAATRPLSPEPTQMRKMIPSKDTAWADPFAVEKDGISYLFFEEILLPSGKGRLACCTLGADGGHSEPAIILDKPYHLSYPFVFDYHGEFYMVPESSGNRSIDLYRCMRFPDQWEFVKTLMDGVRAVDTTLLEKDGRCWLFTNLDLDDRDSGWDELHLFHAPDLLADHWEPHPLNPVVADVRSARPAGRIFEVDGQLYRPSQDGSHRYGYGVKINKIVRLDERSYQEECVHFTEPDWDRKIGAIHTYNFSDQLTLMDAIYKRWKLF
jgi:hypothetical protein